MNLRFCTFNANQRAGGLAFLRKRVEPNVVLVQEAKKASWPGAFMPIEQTEGRMVHWATAVWTDGRVAVEPLPADHGASGASAPAGAFTAALLRAEGVEPIVAVSLHAVFDGRLTITTAERLTDDLEPIIAAAGGERMIIGGDFNAWDQYADGWEVRWRAIWSRLEQGGLVNLLRYTRASRASLPACRCGLGEGCWHVQTVRRDSRALADYLWATPDLVPGPAERCKVEVMDINDQGLVAVSDHSPVWADLIV